MFGMEFDPGNMGFANTNEDDQRRALYMALLAGGGAMTQAAFSKTPGEGLATGPQAFLSAYTGALSAADKRAKDQQLFNLEKQKQQTDIDTSQFNLQEKKDKKDEEDKQTQSMLKYIADVGNTAHEKDGIPAQIVAQATALASSGTPEGAKAGFKILQDAYATYNKDFATSAAAAVIAAKQSEIKSGVATDPALAQKQDQQKIAIEQQNANTQADRWRQEKQDRADAKTDTRVDKYVNDNFKDASNAVNNIIGPKATAIDVMNLQKSNPAVYGQLSATDVEGARALAQQQVFKQRFGTADPMEARDVLATKFRTEATGKDVKSELVKLMPALQQKDPAMYKTINMIIQSGKANLDYVYAKVARELGVGGLGY